MAFYKLGDVGRRLGEPTFDPWARAGIIVEPDRYIRSRNYESGVSGWTLNFDGTGELTGLVLGGDLYSSDWDGGFDLSSGADGSATSGYLLDYGSGSAQFQGDMFLGGDLIMQQYGRILTASSPPNIVISSTGYSNNLSFLSGNSSETLNGYLETTDTGGIVNLLLASPTLESGSDIVYSSLQLGGYDDGSLSFLNLTATGEEAANAQATLAASSLDDGDTTTRVQANSQLGSGDALVELLARSSSGSATITATADRFSGIIDGTETFRLHTDHVLIPMETKLEFRNAGFTDSGRRYNFFMDDSDSDSFKLNVSDSGSTNRTFMRLVDSTWQFLTPSSGLVAWGISGNSVFSPAIYADTSATAANVSVGSDGRFRRSTSSLRYKKGWKWAENLADVELPTPITWFDGRRRYIGFGAEHVIAALPWAATGHENYDLRAVVAVLSEQVKALREEVSQLKSAS